MSTVQAASTFDKSLSSRVANKADEALSAVQDGVADLRQNAPSALSRTAARIETMTRDSLDRAKQFSTDARDQIKATGDRTVMYIKDEPVKSVLIAAAAGAAIVGLVSLLSSRGSRR